MTSDAERAGLESFDPSARVRLLRSAWAIGFVLSFSLVAVAEARAPRRPNVLLILADDMGYGDLGLNGNPQVKTPRLDALARESVRFRSFYVSPVCSPTRASFVDDRAVCLPDGGGGHVPRAVDDAPGRGHAGRDPRREAVIGPGSSASGTSATTHRCRPIDQGFADGTGPPRGRDRPAVRHSGDRLLRPDPDPQWEGREGSRGYCSDVFADAAIRFIEAERSRPFFAYLAFNAPHDPLDRPQRPTLNLTSAWSRIGASRGSATPCRPGCRPRTRRRSYAMVANVDANIGRVLDRLNALGAGGGNPGGLPDRQWPREARSVQRRDARPQRAASTRGASASLASSAGRATSGCRPGRRDRSPRRWT